eukprot:TRINITY_DN47063_c0_g1_i1.p1 TRINITY_DN47063_c0_g1~~TRINITY_DN47063_c0_g1_i1.p1  ORF type:complete len:181 (-),score=31.53 TRINITY_DN47063_c0_g1_i1:37-552(-)
MHLQEEWNLKITSALDGRLACETKALPTQSIAELRQNIARVTSRADSFRLLLGDAILTGSQTLLEAGLSDGATIQMVCLPNAYLATASTDTTAALWSINTGEKLMTFQGHGDQVMWVCISADGQLLATASTDKTAKVWCIDSGECLVTLRGHLSPVFSVTFSPDSLAVATC